MFISKGGIGVNKSGAILKLFFYSQKILNLKKNYFRKFQRPE